METKEIRIAVEEAGPGQRVVINRDSSLTTMSIEEIKILGLEEHHKVSNCFIVN